MNNPFAQLSVSERETLNRIGIIAGVVLTIFGLGYAVGHAVATPAPPKKASEPAPLSHAGVASDPTAAGDPGLIFGRSADARRIIVGLALHFGWAMHRGKNEVALDLTLVNNTASPVKDVELACAFYNKNMKPMGVRKGVIAETIEAKASKSFTRVPVPYMPAKAEHVVCEIIDAK